MKGNDIYKESLLFHRTTKGKIEVSPKITVKNMHDLAVVYTPGVAEICRVISKEPSKIYDLTIKWNTVAVITDGSAVLGLGDIGPKAALPVMEGKALLFKEFANIDAFPLCLNTKDVDEIVKTISYISPVFGGINLEDISSPRCFEIEKKLSDILDIPVFHDDQHGTAVVTLAGLINALKIVEKDISNIKIVINGAGAAAVATAKFLITAGAKNVIVCDSKGIIYRGRRENMNKVKEEIAKITNRDNLKGSLREAIVGADVFIGLSVGNVLDEEMIKSMNTNPIVFAMANPIPEIMPDVAKRAGARIVATGRSDFPNQINNCLGFPGIFRGALDVRAKEINEEMKLSAAYAIASLIKDEELNEEYIIPSIFDERVVKVVSEAVKKAAIKTSVTRI